jgi:hypothetical protein
LHSGILCFYGVTSGLGQGDRCITAGSFLLSERVGANATANTTAVDDMSMIPLIMTIWLGVCSYRWEKHISPNLTPS